MFRLICFFLLMCVAAFAEQKTVLISGATGGIGLATAKAFQERGWKVWAGYRKEIPKELLENSSIRLIPLDITDDAMVQNSMDALIQEEGRLDALINNAGINIVGPEECLTIEEAKAIFEVNYFGALRLIQAAAPHMRKQKSGHIINISSASGFRAIPGMGPYAASKFALEGLSESLAVTLSPWNIKVSLVEPGMVKNEMLYHNRKGSRAVQEPLYGQFQKALFQKMDTLVSSGQECSEIASLIVDVAENPKPDLRYQTSSKVREVASRKLADLTGNGMLNEQMQFFHGLLESSPNK
jgi:NAD(P)-dependent dehydrogenase (short-subunit alcohol dehydrogenase family)